MLDTTERQAVDARTTTARMRAGERVAQHPAPAATVVRPAGSLPLDGLLARAVLQRASGGVLQRKVGDLPTAGLKGRIPDRALQIVEWYNATAPLAAIDSPAASKQQQLEVSKLSTLQELIDKIVASGGPDAPEVLLSAAITDHQQRLDGLTATAVVQAPRVVPVAAVEERPPEPIAFPKGFPRDGLAAKPAKGQRMFAGTAYIEVEIGETLYHLYAGQNYLNPGHSDKLRTDPSAIKGGPIVIYTRDVEGAVGYREAVVGDAHHRFVWTAFHSGPLTARVKGESPVTYTRWSDLTYVKDPKNEYQFGAEKSVDEELFVASVSQLPDYRGKAFGDDWRTFLTAFAGTAKKNPEVRSDDEELVPLQEWLRGRQADADTYENTVRKLALEAKAPHAAELARILLKSAAGGPPLAVAYGPAPSVGYYSQRYNVIVLDPKKNPDADARLDTLAFESGNALRREDYLKTSGKKKSERASATSIEFEVLEGYVRMLQQATGMITPTGLMLMLGVDRGYCVFADAARSIAAGVLLDSRGRPTLPSTVELPEQRKRTAVAAWQQREWTREERLRFFSTSAHAEGMGATTAAYDSGVSQSSPLPPLLPPPPSVLLPPPMATSSPSSGH